MLGESHPSFSHIFCKPVCKRLHSKIVLTSHNWSKKMSVPSQDLGRINFASVLDSPLSGPTTVFPPSDKPSKS